MTSAPQELVENQHEDQFHVDQTTGVKTPIRAFLAHEVERIKGVVEPKAVNEDVERAKAAVEAEAAKVQRELEAENAKLKAKVAEVEAQVEKLKAAKPTQKAAATPAAPETKDAAPASTAVRETGDVK